MSDPCSFKMKGARAFYLRKIPQLQKDGLWSKCWHTTSTKCHSPFKASQSSIKIIDNNFISFAAFVPWKYSLNNVHNYQFKSFKHLRKNISSYQEKVAPCLVPWKSYLNEISHCGLQIPCMRTLITKIVSKSTTVWWHGTSINTNQCKQWITGPIIYYGWKWFIWLNFENE